MIEAAVERVRELGYRATRIEGIVGAAGVRRSTFYLHFKGKIDILHELIAVVEPEAVAIFAPLADSEFPSWRDLRDTFAGFVKFYTWRL
ncbi:MAG: TetR/AcrR family transcriptional regulator [Actinomycetota bacterium]|nr:TetR/AcrR family transcriptional regulator [Actinomycetota bacterium]